MVVQEGYFYHLSDIFFEEIHDKTLMSNKENGGYRPHYFAIRDDRNPDIFWMVPVSSKFAKYKAFYDNQIAKYHRCTKVVLGKFAGTDHAFLVQNAFPVIADYFDHIHTRFGSPATISSETGTAIIKNLKSNLAMHKRGIHLFFADIDRIYSAMEARLKSQEKAEKPAPEPAVAETKESDAEPASFEPENSDTEPAATETENSDADSVPVNESSEG